MIRASRRRLRAAVAIAGIGLLSLAACSSDSKSTTSSGGTSSGASTSSSSGYDFGPEKKATGTPVNVGLVSDGKSAAIDNTPELQAAKAAVEYANTYQNGLNGHVINLVTCETGQTPSGAEACGSKMAEAKVVAALVGVSGQSGSIYKGVNAASIPFFGYANIDADVIIKPGAYVMTNGLAALAGPVVVANEKKITKASVIVTDVPAASGPVSAIGPVFYKNGGVELDIATVPPDAADPSAQIQAKIAAGATQFSIIGNAPFCTASLKAMKALGFTGSIVLIPQCLDAGSGDAIPGGYEGMTLLTSTTDDKNDPEYQLYSAVMDKYAPGVAKGGVATGGYIVVDGFVSALASLTGEVTAASVTATLDKMPSAVPVPLGGGITFQCGTKPISFTPNICASDSLETTLKADGSGTTYKKINTSKITVLG